MARPRSNPPASTETETAKSNHKERVRFIFEPDRHSPNGITFSWLIHKTYGGKEKAAIATRAFWLPFAYRDTGNYGEADLKEMAQQSIWRLEEQIQHLRAAFELEPSLRPPIAPAAPSPLTPEIGPAPTSSKIDAPSGSLSGADSVQSSVLSAIAGTGDPGILDEFGDAV